MKGFYAVAEGVMLLGVPWVCFSVFVCGARVFNDVFPVC